MTKARKQTAGARPALLSRAALETAAQAMPVERLAVPEWGGEVLIRKPDAGARLELFRLGREYDGRPDRHEMLSLCLVRSMLVTETGERMLTDTEEDLQLLRRTDPDGFGRVLVACTRLAALNQSVEETEKN